MRTLTAGKFFERMASRMGIIALRSEAQLSKFKCQIVELPFVIPQYKSQRFIRQEELGMLDVNEILLDF